MDDFRTIIGLWPSLSDFASDIGVKYGTAQVMRFRGQLQDCHWQSVVAAANTRGLPVTYERLASIAARKLSRPRPRRRPQTELAA